eukprot:706568-Hanusia_phi.AAC.3
MVLNNYADTYTKNKEDRDGRMKRQLKSRREEGNDESGARGESMRTLGGKVESSSSSSSSQHRTNPRRAKPLAGSFSMVWGPLGHSWRMVGVSYQKVGVVQGKERVINLNNRRGQGRGENGWLYRGGVDIMTWGWYVRVLWGGTVTGSCGHRQW